MARSWEEAAQKKLTETQARRVIADLYEISSGEKLESSTIRQFFESWIVRKEMETSPRTFDKYKNLADRFIKHLGDRADADLSHLTNKHIQTFRDGILKRLAPATANHALKVIRSALNLARREGLIIENVAERIKTISIKEDGNRRAFTLVELKKLMDVAKGEWRGMILFGLYTGQRLGDIACLTWQNIDLEQNELRLVTSKTGRQQILPLASPLLRYIESLPSSDDPKQPIFPRIKDIIDRTGVVGALSGQFYNLMAQAGLVKTRTHQKAAEGRCAKRTQNEISFHCLRHTATSLMKNAGISSAIVQEFIGHDSPAISQNYTHIETSALKKAADSLPDITE